MKKLKMDKKFYSIPKGNYIIFQNGIFRVSCSSGILWITWPWSGDHFLEKGESLYINSKGKVCVNAFEDSDLEVEITTPLLRVNPFILSDSLHSA